jgi:signal peptidase I
MMDKKRSIARRIGIEVLNVLAPGLGLLRVSGLRAALVFLVSPALAILLVTLLALLAPRPSFPVFFALTAVTMGVLLLLWSIAIVRTWRNSRFRAPATGWARWYGICGAFVLASLGANLAVLAFHSLYKPFYIPSEAMMPTLQLNDRIFADMRGGRHPGRGDIVLFNMPAQHIIYIKRVAALPGDRIAMKGGVPIINGRPALQIETCTMTLDNQIARRLRERLPGETGSHEVLDLGPSELDDMAERVVPANTLFVLGDNRDRSADSRVPRTEGGVDLLPKADLIGMPLFVYWSENRARIGIRLSH